MRATTMISAFALAASLAWASAGTPAVAAPVPDAMATQQQVAHPDYLTLARKGADDRGKDDRGGKKAKRGKKGGKGRGGKDDGPNHTWLEGPSEAGAVIELARNGADDRGKDDRGGKKAKKGKKGGKGRGGKDDGPKHTALDSTAIA
jgi:hypothetical protein